MAATDHTQARRAHASTRHLLATLACYAAALGSGAVGLVAALDHGCPWGWALAGASLLGGVALAERLARRADVERWQLR